MGPSSAELWMGFGREEGSGSGWEASVSCLKSSFLGVGSFGLCFLDDGDLFFREDRGLFLGVLWLSLEEGKGSALRSSGFSRTAADHLNGGLSWQHRTRKAKLDPSVYQHWHSAVKTEAETQATPIILNPPRVWATGLRVFRVRVQVRASNLWSPSYLLLPCSQGAATHLWGTSLPASAAKPQSESG